MKIKKKLTIYSMISGLITFLILWTFVYSGLEKEKLKELNKEIEISNHVVKDLIVSPVWDYDFDLLYTSLSKFLENSYISKIIVKNIDDNIILDLEKSNSIHKKYNLKLEKNGEKIGEVEICYNKTKVENDMKDIKYKINILLLLVMILFIIFNYVEYNYFLKPLSIFREGFKKVSDGVLSYRIDLKRKDEFRELEIYFNKMTNSLKEENEKNEKSKKEIKEKSDELEAAYNEMSAINDTLTETLKELEESENKYRNLFNYSPVGMVIFNYQTGEIKEFNREFLSIFDLKTIDVIKLNILTLITLDAMNKIREKIKINEPVYNYDIELENDKYIILSASLVNKNEKIAQIVVKDITELKKLQKRIEGYAKELELKVKDRTKKLEDANIKIREQQNDMVENAYNRGLLEVTAGVIHNIGNIVNIINLNIEEILEKEEGKENKTIKFFEEIAFQEIKRVENKSENLKKIENIMPKLIDAMKNRELGYTEKFKFLYKKINHLKDIIHLQQNFIGELGTEDYNNMNEILDEVLELYESSIEKRKIKIKFNKGDVPDLLSDKGQLIQIYSNFIKNSYESIEEKGIENGEITITTYFENDNIIVKLKDNGLGIKKEDKDKLFTFGFSTKKKAGKGNGFGLHNTKMILDKYMCDIDINSEYGEFMEFILKIPIKKTDKKR
ncbi:ATP-binding protein [Haliovirga abyssi]|uniref:histidine kinase n=1 Tax=Haliovirga abyssi TaxID=2996794 RepID=A0AAU9DWZ0_9FUSO|nr:ATP-binding protein [Haliovirga abyssi]BDU50866.1 hypothetical protein HLVA_14350 [Haliovirga abyssi]